MLFLFSLLFFFFLPLSLVFCVVQVACSRALLHHVNLSIRQELSLRTLELRTIIFSVIS
jgi:hypothetical protein